MESSVIQHSITVQKLDIVQDELSDLQKFIYEKEFKKYSKNGLMTGDEMAIFCKDLDIDLYEDIFITYFLYRCNCKKFAEVTLAEFATGMQSFEAQTAKDVKSKITYTREELLDVHSEDFMKFWEFLWTFNIEKKKTTLDFEICKLYIEKLLGDFFPLCKSFVEFLQGKKNLGLKKDEWKCFLELCKQLGTDFPKGYLVEEAWPTLFDEYYEEYKKKNNIV